MKWSGHALIPHGIDFVPELVEHARARHAGHAANFATANVWHWQPERTYDFVRTSLEYLPEPDWPEYLRRVARAVAPGGRLVVSHYRNRGEPDVEVGPVLAAAGFAVKGRTSADGVSIAWT
ncbi:MAG: class I SAM-dependent methyltransferase [Planctomycetota bacterium]|jgi:trans-aconitate methyltransferase